MFYMYTVYMKKYQTSTDLNFETDQNVRCKHVAS